MSLPRVLLGVGAEPMSLAEHRRHHGELPPAAGTSRTGLPAPLLAELGRAGLGGRGGAAFPLEAKLQAAGAGRGTPVLVVNATESEPMSVKDRMLLQSLPHLVIDGALALAALLETPDVVVAVDETFGEAIDSIAAALAQRDDTGGRRPAPRIVAIPTGYVTGQETAIVNYLNRGVALPLSQPPRIVQRGVSRRPTVVSNSETLAHVALIARHGAEWFRGLGPEDQPGSALVTLSGGVARSGVYEIAHGSHLGTLIDAAGGLTEPARAFLLGGYSGAWVDARAATTLRLSRNGRAQTTIGAGIVVALPQSACPVAEVANVAVWMDDQSASQCGPCINGLSSIAGALADVRDGHAGRRAFDDIRRWSTLVLGRGACAHPDGLARFVTSALSVFAREFDDHARHGACDACARLPVLLTPRSRTVVS